MKVIGTTAGTVSLRVDTNRFRIRATRSAALPIISSGLCLGAAQVDPRIGILTFVSLVPWLAAIRSARIRRPWLSGLAVGLLAGVPLAVWVPPALVAAGASEPSGMLAAASLVAWLSGMPLAVVGALAKPLRSRGLLAWVVGLAGACFVVEHAVSILPWTVPWVLIGHTQLGVIGVAQLAVVGGVPLVSAAVLALNAALADALVAGTDASRVSSRRLSLSLVAGLIGLAAAGVPVARSWHPEGGTQRRIVLAVQPNLPVEERWSPIVQETNLERIGELTQSALRSREGPMPEFVVWPETTLTVPLDESQRLRERLEETVASLGVPVILGATESSASGRPNRYKNVALWMDPMAGRRAAVFKARSVPVAESGSFLGAPSDRILGHPLLPAMPRVADQPVGSFLAAGAEGFGLALCYEIVFPQLVAARIPPHPIALLNLANDGWLGSTGASERQLLLGSFRAIEQRLPLLRVAHGGISAWIDPFGRVVKRLPQDQPGSFMATLSEPIRPARSERLGLFALPSGTAFLTWLLLGRVIRRSP